MKPTVQKKAEGEKVKVKNIYLIKDSVSSLELELENGEIWVDKAVPTGNCWALYWVKKE